MQVAPTDQIGRGKEDQGQSGERQRPGRRRRGRQPEGQRAGQNEDDGEGEPAPDDGGRHGGEKNPERGLTDENEPKDQRQGESHRCRRHRPALLEGPSGRVGERRGGEHQDDIRTDAARGQDQGGSSRQGRRAHAGEQGGQKDRRRGGKGDEYDQQPECPAVEQVALPQKQVESDQRRHQGAAEVYQACRLQGTGRRQQIGSAGEQTVHKERGGTHTEQGPHRRRAAGTVGGHGRERDHG